MLFRAAPQVVRTGSWIRFIEARNMAEPVTAARVDVNRCSSGRVGDDLLNLKRRTWRWLALLPVLALVTGLFVYLTSTSKPVCQRGCLNNKTLPVLPTVATNLTPPGWVAVPYGKVQISVPASWSIGILDCPGLSPTDGWVSLAGITMTDPPTSCPAQTTVPSNQVIIGPPIGTVSSSLPVVTANGFDAYVIANPEPRDGPAYEVPFPSLDTAITVEGPMASTVLHTLTYSPRAVVLAKGAAPPIPASWHRVAFGHLSAAVPEGWPVINEQVGGGGCLSPNLSFGRPAVFFNTGTIPDSSSCVGSPFIVVQSPMDGFMVDPGRYGPIASEAIRGEPCIEVNHLPVCPISADRYGVLVASVHLPDEATAVAVVVGLGGNGVTARTILHSLRFAA